MSCLSGRMLINVPLTEDAIDCGSLSIGYISDMLVCLSRTCVSQALQDARV